MVSPPGSGASPHPPSAWPHRLAWATAIATAALIVAGGLVTHTESGLAVPDWPTTFGYNMFLYPWSQMVGGVLYEHAHRLLGSLVGLLTVITAAALFVRDPRRGVRTLGGLAVAAVIVQGALGGLRVVLVEDALAMLHGAVAPAFLALISALVLVTAPGWDRVETQGSRLPQRLGPLALATVGALYLQILLGVVVTHTGRHVDAHLGIAAVVSALVPLLASRARLVPALAGPVRRLVALWLVQLALGLATYAAAFHPAALPLVSGGATLLLSLAHRLFGALLLAAALGLALRIARLTPLRAAVDAVGRGVPA